MFRFMVQTSYKYVLFSVQSVLFSLLFIVMFFTLILLAVSDSKFLLYHIIIFDFYDLNDDIIDSIPIIIIILFLIATYSNTFMESLFFFWHNIIVSPSPLLIVFFVTFLCFLPA